MADKPDARIAAPCGRPTTRRLRLISAAMAVVLFLGGCELAPTEPTAGTSQESTTSSDGTTTLPSSGCAFEAIGSDGTFAALLCRYQGLLFEALGKGISIGSEVTDMVQASIDSHESDPLTALASLQNAVAAVEGRIDSLAGALTGTVADLAPQSFDCVLRAGDLLQEAARMRDIGDVPIPDLDDWRTTFDSAVALAATGDLIGATKIACDLVAVMEPVLVQT
jgi:hypothetical protein